MVFIEPECLLKLNDSLEYIEGAGGIAPRSPRRLRFHPGAKLTLTSVGYNRNLNLQLPALSEVCWTIPGENHFWSNRDITIFGYFLSLAPLRFSPQPVDKVCPIPSEFILAMVKQFGTDGWTAEVGNYASDLISRIGINFRNFGSNETHVYQGGFDAALFEKRYLGLQNVDVESRERILTWRSLPTVNASKAALASPLTPESALTWGQDGLVSPQLPLAETDHNQLIRSADTALRVVTPDVQITCQYRGELRESRWISPHMSVQTFERTLGRGGAVIGWIERKVTTQFVNELRQLSASVNQAFESGELMVKNGRLVFYFAGDPPSGVTYLHVVPRGHDINAVKQALLIGAEDIIE